MGNLRRLSFKPAVHAGPKKKKQYPGRCHCTGGGVTPIPRLPLYRAPWGRLVNVCSALMVFIIQVDGHPLILSEEFHLVMHSNSLLMHFFMAVLDFTHFLLHSL